MSYCNDPQRTDTLRHRLVPSVPILPQRRAAHDMLVNGCLVPKGALVGVNIWGIQHSARYWGEDVEEFRPERFLERAGDALNMVSLLPTAPTSKPAGETERERQARRHGLPVLHTDRDPIVKGRAAWLAFGHGPRACLGRVFSLMEQRVTLAMLLRRFTIHLPAGSPHTDGIQLRKGSLIGPRDLELIFRERAAA